METKKLTPQMAQEAISRTLAKSVAYKGKWISTDTGVYFNLHGAVRKVSFDISVYYGMQNINVDLDNCAQIFMDTLSGLGSLTEDEIIKVCIHNRKFAFFYTCFEDHKGEKLLVRELHEKYKRDIDPDRGITGFTSDLKAWAKETNSSIKFFNMRINRKVVYYG